MSIVFNAALAAYTLQQEMGNRGLGSLKAAYGVYLLGTRQLWAPRRGTAMWTGLADPPDDLSAFVGLGDDIIHSERITSILKSGHP